MITFRTPYATYECYVELGEYENGNTAIQLWTEEDGPIATATVNLGEVLPKDQAYIKDYSENEGILEALSQAGVIKQVIGSRISGFVVIPKVELDLEALKGHKKER